MGDFFEILRTKYNMNLDAQQRAAVSNVNGTVLVLAGPGSGKTTVITARTFYLINEIGINPRDILTVTFNKAAQIEMKERFNSRFGKDSPFRATFSTLHSFCFSVIRAYEKRQKQKFVLIEGQTGPLNKHSILKDIYKEINGTFINEEELETLVNEIGYIKNKMIKDFKGTKFKTRNFEKIFDFYEKYKKSNLLIDFDDMLSYCLAIFKKCPDILDGYKKRYKFIQADEGQDFSKVQFEILRLLCSSEENNLFIVADDDQSIYKFRGAEPEHILQLGKYYKDLKIYKLENNYRSSSNIVELSSTFIKSNKDRYDKAHCTNNPAKFDPVIVNVEDELEQLDYLVEKVKSYISKDMKIALLYRNNLSSIPLVERFDREGIPYELRQNNLYFFEHWLVQDVIAFLRFSLDPFDFESFQRIYYKMNRYISEAMMENALNSGVHLPVIECILKTNDLEPFQIEKFNKLIKEFKMLSKMKPLRALKYIEDNFKYFGSIKSYSEHVGISASYLYSLFGILRVLSSKTRTIQEFLILLEKLRLKFEAMKTSTVYSRTYAPVSFATLHSSKGLEYDAVFMIDLINSEIPGEKAMPQKTNDGDESLLEEERRLFYVGMTRAKILLYLLCPQYVNEQREARSTFVNELASILNEKNCDKLKEGAKIEHKKYGKGIITSVSEKSGRTLLDVDFRGLMRTLDLDVCLEYGIINFHSS